MTGGGPTWRPGPGASATCRQPLSRTCTGPSALTPYYPELLAVSAAGDFEKYLSFGIDLAARGTYHMYTVTGPDRVVIDLSHARLGTFPASGTSPAGRSTGASSTPGSTATSRG